MDEKEKQYTLEQIALARGVLKSNPHDPALSMQFVKSLIATELAGLDDLAWALSSDSYGCTISEANDVLDGVENFVKEGSWQ